MKDNRFVKQFFLVFAFFLLAFISIYKLLVIRFEDNDDIVMMLIAAGKYSGNFDNHLVFSHHYFGSFLNLCYQYLPNLEVYTCFLVFVNIVAISLISIILIRNFKSVFFQTTLFFFFAAIFIQNSVLLQFTRSAELLAIAGLICIFSSNLRLVGLFSIAIASMIRFEAAMLIMLLAVPVAITSFFMKGLNLGKQKAAFFLLSMIVAATLKLIDYSYYQDNGEWEYFQKFNEIRGQINDNPNARIDFNFTTPDLGVSDYQLLLLGFPNPAKLDLNVITELYDEVKNVSFLSKISNLKQINGKRLVLVFLFLVLGLLFYSLISERKRVFMIVLIFLFLIVIIMMQMTLKDRIFYPMVYAAIIFALCNVGSIEGRAMKLFPWVIIIFSVFIVSGSIRTSSLNEKLHLEGETQNRFVQNYLKLNKKLVILGASYRLEYNDPFAITKDFYSRQVVLAGWLTWSPFNKELFSSFRSFLDFEKSCGLLIDEYIYKNPVPLIIDSLKGQLKKGNAKSVLMDRENYLKIFEFNLEKESP